MRKLSAHYIFPVSSLPLKNGILCMDDDGTVLDIIDTKGKLTEESSLEFYNGVVVPGFINAHCHLELSHMKDKVIPGKGMVSFISEIIKNRNEDTAGIISCAEEADREMKRNGIVAVADVSNNSVTLSVKKQSSLYYHTFFEVFGLDVLKADELMLKGISLAEEAEKLGIPCSLVPHTPYTLSAALHQKISEYQKNKDSLLSIHFIESAEERTCIEKKSGSLFELMKKMGAIPQIFNGSADLVTRVYSGNAQILLIHNTYIRKDDIDKIKAHFKSPHFVLCPGSNLYIENRLPELDLLIESACNIALGTDSYSSNKQLSILEEMKILAAEFKTLPFTELLKFATLNGARALSVEDRFGSFEKGKRPGVNLITGFDFEKMQISPQSQIRAL